MGSSIPTKKLINIKVRKISILALGVDTFLVQDRYNFGRECKRKSSSINQLQVLLFDPYPKHFDPLQKFLTSPKCI